VVEEEAVLDRWSIGTGAERRDFELRTELPQGTATGQAPVLTLADLPLRLSVRYATPQPGVQWTFDGPKPTNVLTETVVLEPRRTLTSTAPLQERKAVAGAVTVNTAFYWPAPPSKGIGEKTAPLVQWKSTRIDGLTSQPIELHGDFSQTYRPGHHNFSEEFIFEPALEPGMDPAVLGELRAAKIQMIYVLTNFDVARIFIVGTDGSFRPLN
jgi:hypothetical protein